MENTVVPDWAREVDCAITVCDADYIIIYMNEQSRIVNGKYGDPMGHSLMEYHNERSREIIRRIMSTGQTNCYTIDKRGQKKLIYQCVWRKNGEIAGLVELSMPIPAEMPHYIRK